MRSRIQALLVVTPCTPPRACQLGLGMSAGHVSCLLCILLACLCFSPCSPQPWTTSYTHFLLLPLLPSVLPSHNPPPVGTSLIIHNSGLPPATLISFIWVLGGMCLAWILIKFHEMRMDRQAMNMVTQQLAAGGPEAVAASKDLRAALVAAKVQLAGSKGFVGRFFSIKAAHGIIMFVSWINIAGACSGCSAALQFDKIARGLQRG